MAEVIGRLKALQKGDTVPHIEDIIGILEGQIGCVDQEILDLQLGEGEL